MRASTSKAYGAVVVVIALALALAVAELVLAVRYRLHNDHWIYGREQSGVAVADGAGVPLRVQINPFTGFSVPPGRASDWADMPANNLGFFSRFEYPYCPDSTHVVGIFGGSVASRLTTQDGGYLERQLGDGFVVLNYASGSYKQPQQVNTLVLALMLGQCFDIVVNVDGFNEAALGHLNREAGFATLYPSDHLMRGLRSIAQFGSDEGVIRYAHELMEARQAMQTWSRRQARTRSAIVYTVSDLFGGIYSDRYRDLSASPPAVDNDLFFELPEVDSIAEDWERGSRIMSAIAASVDAKYLHVLQPNQYFGERVFNEQESAVAHNEASPYRKGVILEYPSLVEAGKRLGRDGIAFVDGTTMFDSIAAAVYIDDCCHYTRAGNEALAIAIAREVADL